MEGKGSAELSSKLIKKKFFNLYYKNWKDSELVYCQDGFHQTAKRLSMAAHEGMRFLLWLPPTEYRNYINYYDVLYLCLTYPNTEPSK